MMKETMVCQQTQLQRKVAESPGLARKANNNPPPQKKRDMKIITQNIRSFNPIINSAKQRKTDKFKKIEILLKEEKPDIAILTETRHYKEETDRAVSALQHFFLCIFLSPERFAWQAPCI